MPEEKDTEQTTILIDGGEHPLGCPFCGGINFTQPIYDVEHTVYHVRCNACMALGPAGGSVEAAIHNWNKAQLRNMKF